MGRMNGASWLWFLYTRETDRFLFCKDALQRPRSWLAHLQSSSANLGGQHHTLSCLKQLLTDVMVQAMNNPAYNSQAVGTSEQPWQLAAMRTAADFDDNRVAAEERFQNVAALLSGMLHPNVSERMTAKQLTSLQWLLDAGSNELGACPVVLQSSRPFGC